MLPVLQSLSSHDGLSSLPGSRIAFPFGYLPATYLTMFGLNLCEVPNIGLKSAVAYMAFSVIYI